MLPLPPSLESWIPQLLGRDFAQDVAQDHGSAVHGPTTPGVSEGPSLPVWRMQAFFADSKDSVNRVPAALWLACSDHAWIAIPIGSQKTRGAIAEPGNPAVAKSPQKTQDETRRVSAELTSEQRAQVQRVLRARQAWWQPDVQKFSGLSNSRLSQWTMDLEGLYASLEQSQMLTCEGIHWLVVPSDGWEPMARLLKERDEPPSSVVLDWQHQWQDAIDRRQKSGAHIRRSSKQPKPRKSHIESPEPALTIVSNHGLLCFLEPIAESIGDALELDPSGDGVIEWMQQQRLTNPPFPWPIERSLAREPQDSHDREDQDIDGQHSRQSANRRSGARLHSDGQEAHAFTNEDTKQRDGQSDALIGEQAQVLKPDPMAKPDTNGKSGVRKLPKRKRPSPRKQSPRNWILAIAGTLAGAIAIFLFWPSKAVNTESARPPSTTAQGASGMGVTASSHELGSTKSTSSPSSDPSISTSSTSLSIETEGDAILGEKSIPEETLTRSDTVLEGTPSSSWNTSASGSPSVSGLLAELERQIIAKQSTDPGRSSLPDSTESPNTASTVDGDVGQEITIESIIERSLAEGSGSEGANASEISNDGPSGTPSQGALDGMPGTNGPRQFSLDPLGPEANSKEELAKGMEPVGPDAAAPGDAAADRVEDATRHEIPLRNALVHSQARIGKGVSLKQGTAHARLIFSDEAIDKIQTFPTESIAIVGPGHAQWRITIEDSQPEFVVRLSSRPSEKWKMAAQVGVQFVSGQEPILIGPNDSRTILNNLIRYESYLRHSIEYLSNSPFPRRAPNTVDVIGQLRQYRAQQKETERAIELWKEVQRLSNELFRYASIEIEFDPQPAPAPEGLIESK